MQSGVLVQRFQVVDFQLETSLVGSEVGHLADCLAKTQHCHAILPRQCVGPCRQCGAYFSELPTLDCAGHINQKNIGHPLAGFIKRLNLFDRECSFT